MEIPSNLVELADDGSAGGFSLNAGSAVQVATEVAKNPYVHPILGAALGVAGADIMTSQFRAPIETVLPGVPEAIAAAGACVGAMSVVMSTITLAKDSVAIAKMLRQKLADRRTEIEAAGDAQGTRITVAGVVAAAIAAATSIKTAASKWVEPILDGYRASRTEVFWSGETASIAMDTVYELLGGGPNGEKGPKNTMALFTAVSAKIAGTKAVGAGVVIALLCKQSHDPLTYAVAATTVGSFVAGALAASVHQARDRLERGASTGGALISSGIELGSIIATGGTLGVGAVTGHIGSPVRSTIERLTALYDAHPAICETVETAQRYIHKAMQSGLDSATAIERFMSTHSMAVIGAHELATASVSHAIERAKQAGEFVVDHTVDSAIMKTRVGELIKDKLKERAQEIVKEKIEAAIEHGVEINEKPGASVLFKRKVGVAFGKLVELGEHTLKHFAHDAGADVQASAAVAHTRVMARQRGPLGYGAKALGAASKAERKKIGCTYDR